MSMLHLRCAAAAPEDPQTRTVGGVVTHYGRTITPDSTPPMGQVRFSAGSIEHPERLADVKLLYDHRPPVVGSLATLTEGDDGALQATFRLARTAAADDVHALVRDGHLDGLSVGCQVLDGQDEDGVFVVSAARLTEVSVVSWPADSDARITDISARQTGEDPAMTAPPLPAVITADDLSEEALAAIAARLAERMAPPAAAPVAAPALVAPSGPPDAGEYITAFVSASLTGDATRLGEIRAVVADQITTDVPGIVPTPIVSPLIDLRDSDRPVWRSLLARPMPSKGRQFERPRVTQHTAVAQQTAEKTELTSQKMTIVPNSVTKVTFGGTLDVSFQSTDWTDPAIMSILINDFAASYVLAIEQWICAALDTVAGGNTGFTASAADPASVIKAFYDAAGAVVASGGKWPDTVWASVDQWALLGSLVGADDRPLFPNLAPSNAPGGTMGITSPTGSPLGARLVVGPLLPAGTLIVGASQQWETYESIRGMVQAMNVSALGMDIAYYGYAANYTIDAGSFQPITITVGP